MSEYTAQNDPALGSYIRFVEEICKCANRSYVKKQQRIYDREITMDNLPDYGDSGELLEGINWGLLEIHGDTSIYEAILTLTDLERKTLSLSILEDKPMEEVRETLHISLGRAYQLRRKALKKLRATLKGDE